ncbi:hypothetical protein GCM10027058_01750 [Microbacterium neimengense]
MIRMSRSLGAAIGLCAVVLALTACVPEPSTTPSPSGSTSPSESSTSGATPSPSSSSTPRPQAQEIELPASCDALYSASMRSRLDAELLPLNDAGVDLASTQVESLRGLIDSGVPTLRCTWGTAAGAALATSVTIVDPADAPRIQDMLAAAGFVCSDNSGGILCANGNETDFLRGNGWVATSWSASAPDGYTEDIAATLWG